MMAVLVYSLCTLTSFGCAVLLWRGYRRRRLRLLFWSSICFLILTLSNVGLFFDLVVFPTEVDLSLVRNGLSLLAVLVLLYGQIFESQ
jgi:hypothetical protein